MPADRAPGTAATVAVVAVGGALGAATRYLATASGTGWPWPTLAVNVLGCALIGALMESTDPARRVVAWWVRPMLATGVLGGFTTFSAYALNINRMLTSGRAGAAIGYLVTTPGLALLGVVAGSALVRRLDAGGGHGAGAPR